ncbi:MAG: inositol monophosphatase family protein [bacterium]
MKSISPDQYSALLDELRHAVKKTGGLIASSFNKAQRIQFKSRYDMVTETDLASEEAMISHLKTITPEIDILAEESSTNLTSYHLPEGYLWVLDPLDGTTNFAHGFPHFAISIALVLNGKPVLGIVFDPIKNEMFTAIHGSGAFLNSNRLTVSTAASLDKSLLATGFPYKVREIKQNNLVEFCVFRLACQGIRRTGAAALDLAYVAANRLDGFWERQLKPWDTAAGILLVTEAGGMVSRFNGNDFSILHQEIVASNGKIHPAMIHVLTQDLPELPDLLQFSS